METSNGWERRSSQNSRQSAPAPAASVSAATAASAAPAGPAAAQLAGFLRKVLSFKQGRLGSKDFSRELTAAFPLLKAFNKVYLDLSLVVKPPAGAAARPAEAGAAEPAAGCSRGFLIPLRPTRGARPPSVAARLGRVGRNVRPQVPKVRAFWAGRSRNYPHTFKKKTCYVYDTARQKVVVELLDLGRKAIEREPLWPGRGRAEWSAAGDYCAGDKF